MLVVIAMILPGISGAFILILLGAYETALNALDKIKAFEQSYLELLNAKHRDVLDALKAGQLTDEITNTLTKVATDLAAQYA